MSLMAWVFFRVRGHHPERVPAVGPGDPRAESLLVPGPLLPRRGAAPQGPLHGQVAALQAADGVDLLARRRLPGAPRLRRRGGVHHRRDGARPRRHDGDVRRGRPLAHRRAVDEAPARDRPAGAAERRAGRPGGDRRLLPRAQLEARCSSRRSASTTASRSSTNASRRRRATRNRPSPTPSSRRCARSTTRRPRPARPPEPRPRRAACRARAARSARRPRAPRRRPTPRSSCRR